VTSTWCMAYPRRKPRLSIGVLSRADVIDSLSPEARAQWLAAAMWNEPGMHNAREIWNEAKDKETFVSAKERWRTQAGMTAAERKALTSELRDLVKPLGVNCALAPRKGMCCKISGRGKGAKQAQLPYWLFHKLGHIGLDPRLHSCEISERDVKVVIEVLKEWSGE